MTDGTADNRERSVAELLRLAADGELDAQGRAELDARLAAHGGADAARIAFERSLRGAVGRVMSEPARAPEALRARIEGVIAAEHAAEEAAAGGPIPIWAHARRWMAVAAALLLVGATVLIAVRTGAPEGPALGDRARVQLASFMTREHGACAELGSHFQRKMLCRDLERAEWMLSEAVGAPASVASLDGFRFVGIGPCAVPGPGPSVHLLLEEEGGPRLSVFVQRDGGQGPMPSGGPLGVDEVDLSRASVVALRREDLVYYVVSGDAGIRRRALAALERAG